MIFTSTLYQFTTSHLGEWVANRLAGQMNFCYMYFHRGPKSDGRHISSFSFNSHSRKYVSVTFFVQLNSLSSSRTFEISEYWRKDVNKQTDIHTRQRVGKEETGRRTQRQTDKVNKEKYIFRQCKQKQTDQQTQTY